MPLLKGKGLARGKGSLTYPEKTSYACLEGGKESRGLCWARGARKEYGIYDAPRSPAQDLVTEREKVNLHPTFFSSYPRVGNFFLPFDFHMQIRPRSQMRFAPRRDFIPIKITS